MSLHSITGNDLVRCVKAGCIKLEHNRDQVDALNVFPVPDGDTGTNMYLTLLSAVKEGEKHSSEPLGKVAKAISMGSLMGARGNSGVILSQIFRGIAKVLEGKEEANAQDLAQALKAGSDTAYKAVMKPVEGTILTVIREIARACEKEAEVGRDIMETLLAGLQEGHRTLEKTPNMLPVLKEAGVVDSGGRGLLYFLEGAIDGLAQEKEIQLDTYMEKLTMSPAGSIISGDIDLDFQYCTELLIKGENLDPDDVKDHLKPLGDSMLVVGGDEILKVHIHSNHPGKVLETALQFGHLSDIKINNMLEEVHENRHNFAAEKPDYAKKIGIVAVGAGDGVIGILSSLGVDIVVQGGQTMNPSTEDILIACNEVSAPEVIVLPNNKNIIMAAQQVKDICSKKIKIVASRSVMEAISALIAYNPEGDLEEVAAAMAAEMQKTSYAEVTQAVKDSAINGLNIEEGDIIGMVDGKIRLKGVTADDVVLDLLKEMATEESELITLLYGNGVEEAAAEALKDEISRLYPDCDVEMHYGGQPHYTYLLSVE
ncbi:DhaL domain [Syntrophomonas zehnderi OL-4]|uniref:DhaL domain n=1 Tax=Syntrophomonas zehnderi OL-4 TaxID=690567 RepID=A0A0E4C9M8_9FIRM|nr:DAK2 domain-containing protein [Syntrophomonas zehnderi]CFY04739.1 DhaL domain [Syntrophomonas zehnderi OL-4]